MKVVGIKQLTLVGMHKFWALHHRTTNVFVAGKCVVKEYLYMKDLQSRVSSNLVLILNCIG